ncbi:MAG: D-alanyl-D-alanine carboxypeptidase [Oscillospiraceae bacterium]|nr:D-alanyl-D-alanine carboxypeptidase [Oscillospiraceae bacterium]
MKKMICFIIGLAVAALPFFPTCFVKAAEQESASAEILFEAGTGQILYSKNPDKKLAMASVTKTMTLLLVAEAIKSGEMSLDEKVKASSRASGAEGSVIWLEPGEEMSVAELIEAVVVSSANDACIALAEHLAGSEAAFVKMMNARAKELGLKNTRYTNCVGYDENGHYSTARDIAVLTAKLMEFEVLRSYWLIWLDYLRGGKTQLVNTNKLVRYYDGIIGGKTGTTDGAGYCLSVCAERKDMRLVAVALGCKSDDERFDKCEGLLDYGFDSFQKFTPEQDISKLLPIKVVRGAESEIVPIIEQQGVECIIKKGSAYKVEYEYTFVEQVEAPVEKGQFLGEYLVTLDGETVFRSDIVANGEIPRMDFWRCLGLVFGEIISM